MSLHQRCSVSVPSGTHGGHGISVNSGTAKLDEIDESTAALLRYDGGRVAAFVTSFNAADVASYRIVGTKGQLHVDPAYEYQKGWRTS